MGDLLVVGVDPGKSGAVSIVDGGRVLDVFDMPILDEGKKGYRLNTRELVNRVSEYSLITGASCVIEQVHSSPQMGVVSAFNFGGMYRSVITALEMVFDDVSLVRPQEWKRHYGLIGCDKDDSRLMAKAIYPSAEKKLQRKKDVDRAESILIAGYKISKLTDGV